MRNVIKYYQLKTPPLKFNRFMELEVKQDDFDRCFSASFLNHERIVQIIAYCIMPTHIHVVLKQLVDNGISVYIGNVLNSYSKHFNAKHKRKGPLWEGKFKNVLVQTDEQLLHLTRYIHLNPSTAGIVDKPEHWNHSSYLEYLGEVEDVKMVSSCEDLIEMLPVAYKEFVEDRISYQRELNRIKNLILE